jgi:hypothetical protein
MSFNPLRLDVAKWQHFPVGGYGIFQIAGRKELNYRMTLNIWRCFWINNLRCT